MMVLAYCGSLGALAAVGLLARRCRSARKDAVTQQPTCGVSVNDLIREMTVEEVEAEHRIYDPLRAVPDAPFGHLHQCWSRFREALAARDPVWKFYATCETEHGPERIRIGYAIVREGKVNSHFTFRFS